VVNRRPQDYPWALPLREGVLDEAGFHESRVDTPIAASRTPVLASGSNASPEVIRDKLGATLGTDPDHHLAVTGVLAPRLGVGHSAHVSRPGYVAAAPYRRRTTSTRAEVATVFALAWFTPAQLARLDETEPQYHRIPLPPDVPVRSRRTGQSLDGVHLYVSRHGLIAEDGHPVTFRTQVEIFGWLHARLSCLRAATMEQYADAELREHVREELASGGWTAPSLLDGAAQG